MEKNGYPSPFCSNRWFRSVSDSGTVTGSKNTQLETPFGKPSGLIAEGEMDGQRILFLARHGEGHAINPSQVNYRANIYALNH